MLQHNYTMQRTDNNGSTEVGDRVALDFGKNTNKKQAKSVSISTKVCKAIYPHITSDKRHTVFCLFLANPCLQ